MLLSRAPHYEFSRIESLVSYPHRLDSLQRNCPHDISMPHIAYLSWSLSLFLQFFSCYVLPIEYSDHLNVKILSILQSWSFRVQGFKQKTKDLEPHVKLVFQILQAVRSPMSSPACAPRNFAHSDSHSAFTSRCLHTSNLNQRAWWRRFVPVAFGNLTK